jgi:hypothetical protein
VILPKVARLSDQNATLVSSFTVLVNELYCTYVNFTLRKIDRALKQLRSKRCISNQTKAVFEYYNIFFVVKPQNSKPKL